MADDSFKKPQKIEFEPEEQEPYDPQKTDDKPLETEFEEQDDVSSTAAIVVEEYTRTIEFMKFVEQLLREASTIEVEIDPEDDPEVWMAMNRIFSNPSLKMNQESYFQVVDALEAIERIEQIEDRPDADLGDLPEFQEVDDDEITEDDFQISAVDEIEEKAKVTRASAFRDPPPPPPPPKPPIEHPWLRRWRRYYKKVNVLGRPYKVQWLRNRWWRDRYNHWRRR